MLSTFLALSLSMQQVLPAGPLVQGGLADEREPRVAVGVITSNLFADGLRAREGQGLGGGEKASDLHGVVELGTNVPLLRIGASALSIQGGLIARFRLDVSDNDALSSDFMIALPLNYERGPYEARLRLVHRSAHLGDELVQNTSIRRLEFDHEEADVFIARRLGKVRAYAAGGLTLASSFDSDDWSLQLGADGGWPVRPGVSVVAGVDWQKQSIAEGNSRLALAGGITAAGAGGTASLQARYSRGATHLGEFFLDRENWWGVLLVLAR